MIGVDASTILTGSGLASLVLALAYVVKQFVDYRRAGPQERTRDSAAVADAQTANAILNASLTALQEENRRLATRVESVEIENEALRQDMKAKDVKITDLENRLNEIAHELSALKSE